MICRHGAPAAPHGVSAPPCEATCFPSGSKDWESTCTGAVLLWGGEEALLCVGFRVAERTQETLADFHNNGKFKTGEPGHPKISKSLLK